MSVEDKTQEDAPASDYLSMSDDDFDNAPMPDFEALEAAASDDANGGSDSEEETFELDTDGDDSDDDSSTDDDTDQDDDADQESDNDDSTDDNDTDDSDSDADDKNDADKTDYKSVVSEILAPFRANGKTVNVGSVEEVRRLMSMGAGFHKKMAQLKPNLKLLKMLDNQGLLDEAKISHLIDLSKKDPKAINQLLREGNIDPMDLDKDESEEYTPNTYTVEDAEVDLEMVLSDIRDTAEYKDTLNVVNNKWDEASRQVILKNPEALRTLHSHVEMGLYPKIQEIVESERVLGKLNNLSDIAAYKYVAEVLEKAGAFNQSPDTGKKPDSTKRKRTADKQKNQERTAKKKAASSPTSSPQKKGGIPDDINILSMSDEEFAKFEKGLL